MRDTEQSTQRRGDSEKGQRHARRRGARRKQGRASGDERGGEVRGRETVKEIEEDSDSLSRAALALLAASVKRELTVPCLFAEGEGPVWLRLLEPTKPVERCGAWIFGGLRAA